MIGVLALGFIVLAIGTFLGLFMARQWNKDARDYLVRDLRKSLNYEIALNHAFRQAIKDLEKRLFLERCYKK